MCWPSVGGGRCTEHCVLENLNGMPSIYSAPMVGCSTVSTMLRALALFHFAGGGLQAVHRDARQGACEQRKAATPAQGEGSLGEMTAARKQFRAPEKLRAEHDIAVFSCGEPSLDEWLRRRAMQNEESGASRTYVLCEGEGRVIGYYALAVGAVAHAGAHSRVKRNMPDPVPVIVLGRLAIDQTFQGQGLGSAPFCAMRSFAPCRRPTSPASAPFSCMRFPRRPNSSTRRTGSCLRLSIP